MAVNGTYNVTFTCHKLKKSTPGFYWDAANDAALTALHTALGGISDAIVGAAYISTRDDKDAGAVGVPPASASRGKKYVIRYVDDVTQKTHQIEIPGADDHSGILPAGTDFLPLDAGPGLALVTAFEAAVVSPDGNAVTVLQVELDMRNIE